MLRSRVAPWVTGLVACALIAIALYIWPGARIPTIVIGNILAGALGYTLWRTMPCRTIAGLYVLAAALLLLDIGMIINMNYYTVLQGATFANPVLENYDHERYWTFSLYLYDGTLPPDPRYMHHIPGYFGAMLFHLFGPDLTMLIMVNVICAICAIALTGRIAAYLTDDRRVATTAMIMMCLMCYFMAQATTPIKDAIVTMLMAVMTLCLVTLYRNPGRISLSQVLMLAFFICGILVFRNNALMFLCIAAIFFGVHKRSFDKRMAALLIVALVIWLAIQIFRAAPSVSEIASDKYGSINITQEYTRAWDNVVGAYAARPWWQKLALLPVSMIVQFLIPFPWNFSRDVIFGPVEALAHFGYFWYYAGACVMYYVVMNFKKSPEAMRRLALYAIFLTGLIAYFSSGRISRYCLPLLPMLIPAAAYTLIGCIGERKFRIWLCIFTAMLIPTLIICHNLQMSLL